MIRFATPVRHFRRAAAALLVTTSLTMAGAALASAQPAKDPVDVFFDSGFTYCDAKLVAALWRMDPLQAKAELGQKVIRLGVPAAQGVVAAARNSGTRCDWIDVPHSYEDAERLAAYWGLPDPAAAKVKVADLYTKGMSAQVMAALAAAPAPAQSADPYEAFFNAGYTYCDAKLVAALWRTEIDTAKSAIGRKVVEGNQALIPPLLTEARGVAQCEWADLPYTYDDAVALGRVWGVPADRAKVKAAGYYTAGQSQTVEAALGRTG
jgi:hypothetical protein